MSGYALRSEPTHSKVTEGDWVDFPASPEPFPWEALLGKASLISPDRSHGHDLNAKRGGGVVMTSVAIALRGLLVTTAAVATVAYLLLTNSHI